MRIGKLSLAKDKGSTMSNGGWVGYWSYYLYVDDTLLGLIWKMITKFKHASHMVG